MAIDFLGVKDVSMSIENTDLERRVLAHERILQALILELASDDRRIFDRMRSTFARGHDLGEHELDFTSTNQYAEQFISCIEEGIH